MKFRLDAQHYINDRLLEPGHIIGDETDVPMVLSNGDPVLPSVNMTPLDDEARAAFKERFPGSRMPERDPTKAIPLRGTGDTAKSPPLVDVRKGPDGMVVQPTGGGPVETVGNVPGGYVVGSDGESTGQLKKGLPDPGSPNHPVGQPVQGIIGGDGRPTVPPKPQDPALAVSPAQAQAQQTQADKDKAALESAKAEAERNRQAAAAKATEKK